MTRTKTYRTLLFFLIAIFLIALFLQDNMIDITALICFITVCSLSFFLHLVAQTSKKIDQDASRRSQLRFWHNNI